MCAELLRGFEPRVLNTGDTPLELIGIFSVSPVAVLLPDGQPIELPWRS
jgi:hypothetical protein